MGIDVDIDIGLGETERKEIAEGLSRLLSDTYLLYVRPCSTSRPRKPSSASPAQCSPAAERAGDEATADLLTQRLQIHEKTAWMLRSMLEAP